MKKVFAGIGALVFLLVLLVKPFEFMEVYSLHAGHVAHSVAVDNHDGHVDHATADEPNLNQSQSLLMEITSASQEALSFKTTFWLLSLLGIGIITFALSVHRKNTREREQE